MAVGLRGHLRWPIVPAADASSEYLAPEAQARMEIDKQLKACGWVVQDYKYAAVAAAQGVAVREVPTEAGPADYVLFVDAQAVGVIEAKKSGSTLTGVEPQTRKYQISSPNWMPKSTVDGALPFGYESTGSETRFTCGLDPVPTSRPVFTFHQPDTMSRWLGTRSDRKQLGEIVAQPTLRLGVHDIPELEPQPTGLWPAQAEAIRNLEESFRAGRPRALVQMATGAGKTFTAANVCNRLLQYAKPSRILFLVDRANLGRQAVQEFKRFSVPGDGRKFTDLYRVRNLTSSQLVIAAEPSVKVHVSTIQRLYSILRGDEDYDESLDEVSGFETAPDPAGGGVIQPEGADRVLRLDHHRRVSPFDIRGVAPGAGVLRRLLGRAHGYAGHPDVRVLRSEHGDGVRP